MDQSVIIALLFIAGFALVVAELFVPSGGFITIAAICCLGTAVYLTFGRNTTAGLVSLLACIVMVPAIMFLGIKYVRYLPMGNELAPPNPTLADGGLAFDTSESERFIGMTGRAVTPLRPVGVCEFDGRRVQCVAQTDMLDEGVSVVGVEMRLNNLVVRPTTGEA